MEAVEMGREKEEEEEEGETPPTPLRSRWSEVLLALFVSAFATSVFMGEVSFSFSMRNPDHWVSPYLSRMVSWVLIHMAVGGLMLGSVLVREGKVRQMIWMGLGVVFVTSLFLFGEEAWVRPSRGEYQSYVNDKVPINGPTWVLERDACWEVSSPEKVEALGEAARRLAELTRAMCDREN